jgi:sugar phosphate permease
MFKMYKGALLFVGFFTFGPHILLAAAIHPDLGLLKAAPSATGFIDAMGYVGATFTGVGTGYFVEKFGWNAGFYFLIFGSIVCGNNDGTYLDL